MGPIAVSRSVDYAYVNCVIDQVTRIRDFRRKRQKASPFMQIADALVFNFKGDNSQLKATAYSAAHNRIRACEKLPL